MYLFIDTETTGLSHHNDHVVQIAWVLTDEAGNIKTEECHVIRPNGYSIPPAAARVHGITTAKACEIGQPLGSVLQRFSDVATRATLVVAHNLSFDLGILQHDYKIACLPFPLHGKTQVCTMRLSTAWCRLPKLNGSTGFKYPRLDELHYRLFGVGFDGAHDALADTHACRRSHFELVSLGVITPPSVLEQNPSVETVPAMAKRTDSILAQPIEPPQKMWSYDSETKILENNLTGIKYSPNRYEHHSYSGVSGFAIFFGPDTWANDDDVDYTNASRVEMYVAASNKAAIEKLKTNCSTPVPARSQPDESLGKEWSYDSETKILANNFTGMEYWPVDYEHQRTLNKSGYQILHGPDVWVNDWDVVYTNGAPIIPRAEAGAAEIPNVADFAKELGLPVDILLVQLQLAGISKVLGAEPITEQDKVQLLEYLRNEHKLPTATAIPSLKGLSASGSEVLAPPVSHGTPLQLNKMARHCN